MKKQVIYLLNIKKISLKKIKNSIKYKRKKKIRMRIKKRKTRQKRVKNKKKSLNPLLKNQRKNFIFSMKFRKKMQNYLRMSIKITGK